MVNERDDYELYASEPKPVRIRNHVWFGMNATTTKGATLAIIPKSRQMQLSRKTYRPRKYKAAYQQDL